MTSSKIVWFGRPNVCPYEDMAMVMVRQPCVQAFTRLVKVWKPNCGYTRNWCVGYERRTHYYTTYKEKYQPQKVTKYKCCNGWTQSDQSGACNNRLCQLGSCYNGGRCNDNVSGGGSGGSPPALCSCPPGFQGSRCQYGKPQSL
ncbi:hypothetical protein RRG08_002423 [Elysia crispata]|uniref:EGF-like domain-containing protein n=1 Tax=Elysia crispata TaxID=231223 RepID=A0AAE0ZFX7_9GAST|nr:hypothetical protein RRG08_002423 [Elysia crispata]